MRRIVFVLLGILGGLTLTETVTRLSGFAPLPLGIASTRGIVLFNENPNGYFRFYLNSQYFRTPEFPDRKARGEKRVLLLGDSHAWGTGVDDELRFANRLQRMLEKSMDTTVSVCNLAMPSSTFQDYITYFKTGMNYSPDLVVLIVFSGNDLLESWLWPRTRGNQKTDEVSSIKPLLRHLYVYHLAAHWLNRDRSDQRKENDIITGPSTQGLSQAKFFQENPEMLAVALEKARLSFEEFVLECSKHKKKLAVFVLPSKVQVDSNTLESLPDSVTKQIGVDRSSIRSTDDRIHDAMVNMMRDVYPETVDLRDSMKEIKTPDPQYWPRDWHLSNQGHEVVAGIIYDNLESF
jgi:hypothetical protein